MDRAQQIHPETWRRLESWLAEVLPSEFVARAAVAAAVAIREEHYARAAAHECAAHDEGQTCCVDSMLDGWDWTSERQEKARAEYLRQQAAGDG